jgi:hypothetical protein
MNNANNNGFGLWPVIIIAMVLGIMFAGMFSGSTGSTTQSFTPDPTSREYRYVKERVKLEGYSDRDAAQAADAIMKFHNAQQARQR